MLDSLLDERPIFPHQIPAVQTYIKLTVKNDARMRGDEDDWGEAMNNLYDSTQLKQMAEHNFKKKDGGAQIKRPSMWSMTTLSPCFFHVRSFLIQPFHGWRFSYY